MKIKALLLSLTLLISTIAGCAPKEGGTQTPQQNNQQQNTQQQQTTQETPKTDATTTASIVANAPAFLKAVSKDGTWIAATVVDLTIDQDVVVEGKFENKGVVTRKIALYTQDDKRNVTARFTLKAPKMVVRSENTVIQSGTFVGDVYVEAKGFKLVDAKIDGNLYFANEEFKSAYTKDDKSSVTKAVEVKQ